MKRKVADNLSPILTQHTATMLRSFKPSNSALQRLRGRRSWRSHNKASFSAAASDGDSTPPKGTPYSNLTVGVPKENFPLEKRVAASPESVERLIKPGFSVLVENGAGVNSFFSNADYEKAGAKVVSAEEVWKSSDIVMKLRPPTEAEVSMLDNRTLISFIYPKQNEGLVKQLQDQAVAGPKPHCIRHGLHPQNFV